MADSNTKFKCPGGGETMEKDKSGEAPKYEPLWPRPPCPPCTHALPCPPSLPAAAAALRRRVQRRARSNV